MLLKVSLGCEVIQSHFDTNPSHTYQWHGTARDPDEAFHKFDVFLKGQGVAMYKIVRSKFEPLDVLEDIE